MRVYNFPDLYDGELFCGTIARFKFRDGMNRSNVGNVLFDNRRQEIGFSCVKNLETICNSLGKNYTPEEIIRNHSMLNIFLPFLEPEKQQQLLDNVLKSDLEERCCIVMDELNLNKERFIKYCPECAKEDVELYGETYIHREHQIRKVNTCYKHGLKLLNYPFDYNKFGDLCNLDYSNMLKESYLDERLNWKFAKDAAEFLGMHRNCSKNDFIEKYMALYIRAGYCYENNQVDKNRIAQDFIDFYGLEFIQQYTDISVLDKGRYNELVNWICSLNKLSLMQHVLILNFFGISNVQFYNIGEGLDLDQVLPSRVKSAKGEKNYDENICRQLEHYYNSRIKEAYKFRELMPETMFKGIGLKDWRNLIKDLPLCRKYLSSICQTREEANLKYCISLINNAIAQSDINSISLLMIRNLFVGTRTDKHEDFDLIINSVKDYLDKLESNII